MLTKRMGLVLSAALLALGCGSTARLASTGGDDAALTPDAADTSAPSGGASADATGQADATTSADAGDATTDAAIEPDSDDTASDDSASDDTASDDTADSASAIDSDDTADGVPSTAVYPKVDPEPPPPCAAASAKPGYFQFLDDLCSAKQTPPTLDPAFACPSEAATADMVLADGTVATYAPSSTPLAFESAPLQALGLPQGIGVALLLIRRVGGVPHYRALGLGAEVPLQPWSTTKFIAAANAASMMRVASGYKVGLTAKAGPYAVGDLFTTIVNYDETPYTSNGIAAWFHDIGGRVRANDLIHDLWLGRPAAETFGGNYGAAVPPLGKSFVEADGATLTMPAQPQGTFANKLSLHTLADALRRVVLHREEPTLRLPGLQWKDIEVLLYGAPGSSKAGGWGGLSANTAVYVQSGYDFDWLTDRAKGQWRIFGKLGLGTKGQFVEVDYACFPALDAAGTAIPGMGREFVLAVHLDQGGASWAARDRLLAKATRTIVRAVIEGRL